MDITTARSVLKLLESSLRLPIDTAAYELKPEFLGDTLEFLAAHEQIQFEPYKNNTTELTATGKKLLTQGTPFRAISQAFRDKDDGILTAEDLQVCALLQRSPRLCESFH